MVAPTDVDLYSGEILPLDEHMAVVRIITAAFFCKEKAPVCRGGGSFEFRADDYYTVVVFLVDGVKVDCPGAVSGVEGEDGEDFGFAGGYL